MNGQKQTGLAGDTPLPGGPKESMKLFESQERSLALENARLTVKIASGAI
jgi:hypothetical protein